MNIEMETLDHRVAIMYIFGKASGNGYTKAYYNLAYKSSVQFQTVNSKSSVQIQNGKGREGVRKKHKKTKEKQRKTLF